VKRFVLDSSALLTLLLNRPGADKIGNLMELALAGRRELSMSVINWGEVYYSVWRDQGPGFAHHFLKEVVQLPIALLPVDLALTQRAAEFKANCNLPYADCFAAALAVERQATLATSDQDFASVQKKINILWAR